MINSETNIINKIIQWIEHGLEPVLFTVISTWGSSPRPVGSLFAININNETAGSISGGCIEDDLILRYKNKEFIDIQKHTLKYQPTNKRSFGLPCGGTMELLVENNLDIKELKNIASSINNNKNISRSVCIESGVSKIFQVNTKNTFPRIDNNTFVREYGPEWNIIIFGAGEVSEYVSNISVMLNYKVDVVDPEKTFSNKSQSTISHTEMPDDFLKRSTLTNRSIILALSHNPKIDDMGLIEALEHNVFYIGVLGSKKTIATRLSRLREMDVSEENINKLHAPVGLHIGSHTPAEIAVSIMAEITKLRNLG